ncbi:MAG: hypothetical protein ACT4OJ_02715 [Bacteroidota bacterium]
MKKIFFVAAAFLIALLLAFRHADKQKANAGKKDYSADRQKKIIRCSPDWEALKGWLEEADIPPMPGAGSHQWKISTNNDSAQFYFNQGINMYYGFHIIEAMASFKKAAKFDSTCAMIYWAQALAYGPNINDFGYSASPEALTAVQNAKAFMDMAPGKEKMLIYAQLARYSADSTQSRQKLNQLYVDKMKQAYERYPNDGDMAALYADAMMLQHPWDLWNTNGTPKPWTPLIRDVLEETLAQYPDHPGNNHYYIHVMEPSPFANKALPSAAKLGITNPGLSHLVHMPSHIYLRTGKYQTAVDVNVNAVNSYKISIPLFAPVTGADFLYIIHNLHMKANNAMLSGQYQLSIDAANETVVSVPADYLNIAPPMGSYLQYIHSTPILVYIRFGKWDELIKMPQPGPSHSFANIMYHFGRGLAFAKQKKFDYAGAELDQLREWMKDTSLRIPFVPFSPSIEGARVAEQLLLGAIHEERNLYNGAIRHFRRADSIEVKMVYNEPRDWMLNPKHFLGNAYLKAGRTNEAKIILQKDLLNNNENGWALFGIWQALTKEKKTAEATKMLIRFKKAFAKADVKLYAPVF